MDINDILGVGGHVERPTHPDFFRLLEIGQQMKAEMEEHHGDPWAQEQLWRTRVEAVGDFDSISYHAIQIGFSIIGVQTGADLRQLSAAKRTAYVSTVQAFFDGILMGAQFEKRGGHQEVSQA